MSADGFYRDDVPIEQLRVPPQSIEAEQAVLGGLMLAPDALDIVGDLTEEDFYRRDHRLIWRAIKHCAKKGRPIDAVTLGEWFEKQGMAEQVAGGAYLVELASTTPSAANIRAYADIVLDKSLLRRVIEVGTDAVNSGFQPDGRETLDIVGELQTRVGRLLEMQPCELEPTAPIMQRVFDHLQELYAGTGTAVVGLPTGLEELDDLIGGLGPGDLIILAARPGMGKTTLAQNIAEAVALKRKKRVAVFSFEMQPEQIGSRMLASVGDIDGARLRTGQLDDADWANVTSAMRTLRAAPIMLSRPRTARVEHVTAQVRRQHAKDPFSLVIIDYLQLMQTAGDNRAQGIGDITRALKLMAGELGIPVILLSQLNRDLEKRPDKRPQMADLRDSGAIEQDADVILFIYRDDYYDKHSRYAGTAEIIVAKQRQGRQDTVRVGYRPERFRFENLPMEWEPAPAPEKAAKRGFRRKGGSSGADAAAGDA